MVMGGAEHSTSQFSNPRTLRNEQPSAPPLWFGWSPVHLCDVPMRYAPFVASCYHVLMLAAADRFEHSDVMHIQAKSMILNALESESDVYTSKINGSRPGETPSDVYTSKINHSECPGEPKLCIYKQNQ